MLAQAVVPQQDLDVAGLALRIQVLEGCIGKRTVTGAPGSNLAASLAPFGAERPATLATLERQLLLVNELPGVQARADLRAGSVPNASELELIVRRTPWTGSLALRNRIGPSQADVRIDADGLMRPPPGERWLCSGAAISCPRPAAALDHGQRDLTPW